MAANKKITIEQVKSANRRPARQTETLIGLGLNKIGRRAVVEDTPAIRGMLNKMQHLVRIVDGK